MVSIKSLAVILFAAAVTATPVAGGEDHGHGDNVNLEDNSQHCPQQGQEMFCCNDDTGSKASGSHVGFLNGIRFKCNSGTSNVWAVDPVSGQIQCSGKVACCTSQKSQNGPFDLALGCVAPAGPN